MCLPVIPGKARSEWRSARKAFSEKGYPQLVLNHLPSSFEKVRSGIQCWILLLAKKLGELVSQA
jgi:hypothetical protein